MSLRFGILAVAACGVLALGVGCEQKPGTVPATQQPAGGGPAKLVIEPEVKPSVLIAATAGEIHKPMVIQTDPEAAGGKFVVGPVGPNHTHKFSIGGDVTLRLSVAKAGDYRLWFRTHWCCACGNSVDVILDGADLGTVQDMVFQTWHWVPLRQAKTPLTAGEHVLVVRNREDGSAFDQVLLTQDADYRPTGVESPVTPGRTLGTVAAAPSSPAAALPPQP